MPNYKIVDADQLDADLLALAEAIRAKGGTTAALSFPDGFETAVKAIVSGGGGVPDGFTELNGGTVVYTSNTKSVTVEHGLSGKPKGVFFYREGADDDTEKYVLWAMHYPYTFYNTNTGGVFSSLLAVAQTVSIASIYSGAILDETSFAIYASSYNYYCKANTTYRWLAWR